MRIAILAVVLLCACGALLLAQRPASTLAANKVTQLKSFHTQAVLAVSSGKSADEKLSFEALKSYSKAVAATSGGHVAADMTYREAIAQTEDVMKDSGLRSKVLIVASPGKCNVKYRPVVGGDDLDAGLTDLATSLAPKWYVFTCDCTRPPTEKKVDCTEDKKVTFSCQ